MDTTNPTLSAILARLTALESENTALRARVEELEVAAQGQGERAASIETLLGVEWDADAELHAVVS